MEAKTGTDTDTYTPSRMLSDRHPECEAEIRQHFTADIQSAVRMHASEAKWDAILSETARGGVRPLWRQREGEDGDCRRCPGL